MKAHEFLGMVDHTLLKPEATREQVSALCGEARALRPASVCVNGLWVAHAAAELDGSDLPVCSVIGFPLGAMTAGSVAHEAGQAVADGAREIDMVIPLGLLRGGEDEAVQQYVAGVRQTADQVVLKVILEAALLEPEELRKACRLAVAGGADYVKTSTGFNPAGGATEDAVRLMRETVGDAVGVKASGGIRTKDDVERMVAAGASRLGMSAAAAVAREFDQG